MTCPNCQTQLPDNAQFCPRCGTRFQFQAAPPAQAQYQMQQQQPASYAPQGSGVSATIEHGSSFALACVTLGPEQSIQAESGAMVGMSANVELISQMKGGLFGALKRAVVGESMFVSTFVAHGGPGEVLLAPPAPGDVAMVTLQNQTLFIQGSSFLASSTTISIDTKFGGAKSFFSSEGLFLIAASGTGLLLLSSFGAIRKKTLRPGEQYVVDTGHIVAFDSTVSYTVEKAARGFFRSMTSGEGLVSRYTGPGDIYIQTRNLEAFASILKPFLPTSSGG
jgi:uncharacterized protein (TIGR00266 family)